MTRDKNTKPEFKNNEKQKFEKNQSKSDNFQMANKLRQNYRKLKRDRKYRTFWKEFQSKRKQNWKYIITRK